MHVRKQQRHNNEHDAYQAMHRRYLHNTPLPSVSDSFVPKPETVLIGPRCWDGKNLDSPDHQSHMYNTVTSEGFTNAPKCPASHPIRVPQVTFETVWDTTKFNSMWPSGGANPFVWSFEGSPTGYGTHADYLFGWKGDSLQKAMDKSECFYDGCGSIKKQQMATANQCTVKDMVGEKTDGCKFETPQS
jgi:hypothetical protein